MPPAFDWGPFLAEGPLFIGILNLTPDSFSDGGRYTDPALAVAQARFLLRQGARMLDLGAESTRPGADPIGPDEEWRRLEPVLGALREALPTLPLSLDTRHVETARRGLASGITTLNDITGFTQAALLELAATSGCGLIAMRSRLHGGRLVMPPYEDPTPRDASTALGELAQVRDRLAGAGIPDARVLLDPGFGFGTTFLEDLALWRLLPDLGVSLGWPLDRLCLGLSRKRFLATRAGTPALPPAERDGLTAQAHREAMAWGFRVFRTHTIG